MTLVQSNRKLTVAQIIPSLNSGGVERGVIDICQFLKLNNQHAIVISQGGKMTNKLIENGITFIKLDVKSKNPFTIFYNIRKLKKIIKKYNIDIIHVRSRAPMWSAYFACKQTKTKIISTIHGTYSTNLGSWQNCFLKKLYNSLMLKSDYVIAVSNYIKDYLYQNYPEKMSRIKNNFKVIHRGVDLDNFDISKISPKRKEKIINDWQISKLETKLIFVPARITSWKGHEFLVDALNKVEANFLCIFAGSNHGHETYQKRLEEKIINLELDSKIKIVGNCQDMAAAYSICDFVIAPSVKPEAFGRIPIEAQSCSKPIIATNIGGFLETIINEKTGFIVENKNVNQLATIIQKLLILPKEELVEIGNAGRENAEKKFSNQKMLTETFEIYQKIIK